MFSVFYLHYIYLMTLDIKSLIFFCEQTYVLWNNKAGNRQLESSILSHFIKLFERKTKEKKDKRMVNSGMRTFFF